MSLQTDLPSHSIPGEIPAGDSPEHAMTLDDLVLDASLPKVQVQLFPDTEKPRPTQSTLLTDLQCEV